MRGRWLLVLAVLILGSACAVSAGRNEAPRMGKEELKGMLGSPELVLLDVRAAQDWRQSSTKIAGAIRENPDKSAEWADKYPRDRTVVLYCS